jgi:Common central domain of tyrosinase
LRDWFYRVLLITPYEAFATNKADISGGVSGKYSSCEDIHDVLHDWGGGSFGHMGAPAVGAFDPLFWLHHK